MDVCCWFAQNGVLSRWRYCNWAWCCVQIEKGKLHGCVDVGLSVMAIKKKAKCIDLDAEENIYHLKVNSWPAVKASPSNATAPVQWHASSTLVLLFCFWYLLCRLSLRSCLMNGCLSCVTIGYTGRMRSPCTLTTSPSTTPTTPRPAPPAGLKVPLSERYGSRQFARSGLFKAESAFSYLSAHEYYNLIYQRFSSEGNK